MKFFCNNTFLYYNIWIIIGITSTSLQLRFLLANWCIILYQYWSKLDHIFCVQQSVANKLLSWITSVYMLTNMLTLVLRQVHECEFNICVILSSFDKTLAYCFLDHSIIKKSNAWHTYNTIVITVASSNGPTQSSCIAVFHHTPRATHNTLPSIAVDLICAVASIICPTAWRTGSNPNWPVGWRRTVAYSWKIVLDFKNIVKVWAVITYLLPPMNIFSASLTLYIEFIFMQLSIQICVSDGP